jgi:FkbM family methyltransferase
MSIKRKLKNGLVRLFCRAGFQSIFEFFFKIALVGQNLGGAKNVVLSGELDVLKLIKKFYSNKKDKIIIFDVGANKGDYSGSVLDVFADCDVQIEAFEPSRFAFSQLNERYGKNEKVGNYNLGLGDEAGVFNMYYDQAGSKRASIFKGEQRLSESVQLTTIDGFCQTAGITKINFLKIDVEGYEFKVLKGAAAMLAMQKIDFIQFEFGIFNIEARSFFKDFYFMLNDHFKIYRILNHGLRIIKKYDEKHEIFVGSSNYLAVGKCLEIRPKAF